MKVLTIPIFKAVFTAGGPRAGKSSLKTVDSCQWVLKLLIAILHLKECLNSMGMDATPDNIYSPQGQ